MAGYKRNSSVLLLVVFLLAQLGEPLHFLWVSHSRLAQGNARENSFKTTVLVHHCSHFNFYKHQEFLPPGSLGTDLLYAIKKCSPRPFYYTSPYKKQRVSTCRVRGPPFNFHPRTTNI